SRRPHHRHHPGALRRPTRAAMDRGGGVRLPDHDHGPAAPRPARRGDARGGMSELVAQINEWRDALSERLPPWSGRALAGALIVVGALLPFAFAPTSGFIDATIKALAFVVMALGLNIVVGFAGLLDLGYVAFYAIGAYALGWFGSTFFFKANAHVLATPQTADQIGIHLNFILIAIAAAIICAI